MRHQTASLTKHSQPSTAKRPTPESFRTCSSSQKQKWLDDVEEEKTDTPPQTDCACTISLHQLRKWCHLAQVYDEQKLVDAVVVIVPDRVKFHTYRNVWRKLVFKSTKAVSVQQDWKNGSETVAELLTITPNSEDDTAALMAFESGTQGACAMNALRNKVFAREDVAE